MSVGTWVVLDSISGTQGNQWIEIVEDLSAYANKTVKIKFTAQKSSGTTPQQGDIAVDDLSIVEATYMSGSFRIERDANIYNRN